MFGRFGYSFLFWLAIAYCDRYHALSSTSSLALTFSQALVPGTTYAHPLVAAHLQSNERLAALLKPLKVEVFGPSVLARYLAKRLPAGLADRASALWDRDVVTFEYLHSVLLYLSKLPKLDDDALAPLARWALLPAEGDLLIQLSRRKAVLGARPPASAEELAALEDLELYCLDPEFADCAKLTGLPAPESNQPELWATYVVRKLLALSKLPPTRRTQLSDRTAAVLRGYFSRNVDTLEECAEVRNAIRALPIFAICGSSTLSSITPRSRAFDPAMCNDAYTPLAKEGLLALQDNAQLFMFLRVPIVPMEELFTAFIFPAFVTLPLDNRYLLMLCVRDTPTLLEQATQALSQRECLVAQSGAGVGPREAVDPWRSPVLGQVFAHRPQILLAALYDDAAWGPFLNRLGVRAALTDDLVPVCVEAIASAPSEQQAQVATVFVQHVLERIDSFSPATIELLRDSPIVPSGQARLLRFADFW